MNTLSNKQKVLTALSLLIVAKYMPDKEDAFALIEEAIVLVPDLKTISSNTTLWQSLPAMIDWVKNMSEQSTNEELKEYTVSNKLKKVLIATHNTGADYIVFPSKTFEDEYLLPNDDKSYVIFHKKDTDPDIIDKLDVNKQPKSANVWKNWIMTITYHA